MQKALVPSAFLHEYGYLSIQFSVSAVLKEMRCHKSFENTKFFMVRQTLSETIKTGPVERAVEIVEYLPA